MDRIAGVQKLHRTPVPRIGGVAVLGGVLIGCAAIDGPLGVFLLAAIPAFAAGLVEDLTGRVSVRLRLMATLVSGLAFCLLSGHAIDLPGLPPMLLFTAFAVAGIAHAMNIIDGADGLAGGTAVIVLCGFSVLALLVRDTAMLAISVVMIGALLGFLVLNFPGGKLFLGDGGAYLIGILLAAVAVALPARNADLSPLTGLVVLAYPVIETCTTILRRMRRKGGNPGQADRLHLHSLFYRHRALRLARLLGRPALRMPLTSAAMWGMSVLAGGVAVLLRGQDAALLLAMGPLVLIYLAAYRSVALITPKHGRVLHRTGPRIMPAVRLRAIRASP